MTIGRLSIDFYAHKEWDYNVGICGCKILEIPGVCFTWHDRRCVCDTCSHYVCKCVCSNCEFSALNCDCPGSEE